MRNLKRNEMEEIKAYDLKHKPRFLKMKKGATLAEVFGCVNMEADKWAARRWMQRTRFYNYLTLNREDVEVRTVAVKCDRHGEQWVKEVLRASVGSEKMMGRDFAYGNMSGYVVDWSPEGISRNCCWNDTFEGMWGELDYSRRGAWRLHCTVINPEILTETARWKYNSWRPECGDILGYLKLYSAHPRIEMLVKIGLPQFAAMSGFVKQLESDKGFMRYVSKNVEAIKAGSYGADVVRKAYKLGVEFSRAWQMITARRSFNGRLPMSVDAEKATAYIKTQRGMTQWDYCHYLERCVELGQNLDDTKVSFPRKGHRRMVEVAGMVAARRSAKDAAERKRMAKDLAARAERFGVLSEKVDGGLVVHVPKKEQEFKAEGKALNHCVGTGGYAFKMARGESLVVFVRDASAPDQPFVTVEIHPSSGKVLQCYGKNNSRPSDEVLNFVEKKVAPAVARIAKREAVKGVKNQDVRRVA